MTCYLKNAELHIDGFKVRDVKDMTPQECFKEKLAWEEFMDGNDMPVVRWRIDALKDQIVKGVKK